MTEQELMERFDPINCSKDDQDKMIQGYMYAIRADRLPQDSSLPYRHGWRVGRNDTKGKVEPFQLELIDRMKP